jgi:phosphatidylinositol 3-kinase
MVETEQLWVDVTWMPHSSLSQTSHVAIAIRELSVAKECRVQVKVEGLGGLDWTVPSQTTAAPDGSFYQVLQLPIRWRDLPRDATLKFDIIAAGDAVIHKTSLEFFDTYGRLKTGLQRVMLDDCEEDDNDRVWKSKQTLDQLEYLSLKPSFGQVQSIPWLDDITRQHCHKVMANAQDDAIKSVAPPQLYLLVELPTFDVPILHEETLYQLGNLQIPYNDFEREHDNPVEDKYRTLAHDLLRGLVDPALKPDREQRDRLATIIASPSHHPTLEEKDLLWRFRFSLVDNRRALTKFLLAVDWTVESEVVQAAELLEQWRQRSPIEVTDALKLLGKHVAFQTSLVRSYAIDTLAAAPDDELRLYLLQLVQAIKYENMNADYTSSQGNSSASLAHFLIERASKNIQLATYLYWYLKVELQDPTHGPRYQEVLDSLQARLAVTDEPPEMMETSKGFMSLVGSVSSKITGTSKQDSADRKKVRSAWDILETQDTFITGIMELQATSRDARGKKDAKEQNFRELLAKNGFDRKLSGNAVPLPCAPHLMVDGVHSQSTKMFKSALYPALVEFRVDRCISSSSSKKKKKESQSPLSSSITTPKKADSISSYKIIVKTGDDLRQDQLVMMMIQLMDGLLKRGTLDLCLTPYSIIAMSASSGLMEFVAGSMPISQILAMHNNSILSFFKDKKPQPGAKYDVKPDVLSTYIRSCAGYCVITYLLGVGDRHLDNIMLQASGHFFHIDFGFIFGRDPKPLPPAFRLTREVRICCVSVIVRWLYSLKLMIYFQMVDGMGGQDSAEYRQFCSLACQAFNILRKSAGLVLNLLHLMSDAGIEDLSNNPAADADGVISSVETRFRLELTDEEAEKFFLGLINDCLVAIAPRVMDVFHSIAVSRR